MSTTADTTRHLCTLRQGDLPWHWTAVFYGHVQPRGYRTYRKSRFLWQFHLTPIHIARDSGKWQFGLCWGRRTIYVLRHR